jgi:Tol biopolymer transport system component/DNA-binding CsgD family transcriptional regulator
VTNIGRATPTPERLTPRQREVLELLRRGDTNEEIARSLGISLDGAKWHVSEIIGRLGVSDRYEAARWHPERERRPWWSLAWLHDLRWSTAAKATSFGALAVVTVAIIALAWGIWRTSDKAASIAPAAPRTLVVSAVDAAIAVDTDTGMVTERFNALKDMGYLISPDGSRSAFECADYAWAYNHAADDAWCIWDSVEGPSVAVSRSQLPAGRLLREPNGSRNFVWSPDGTKFAFLVYQRVGDGERSGSGDVYVKDLLSGDLRMVDQGTSAAGRRALMRFSPDGRHFSVIAASPHGGPVGLLVVDLDTNARHILTRDVPVQQWGNYAWSPDSRSIAFIVNQDLYVIPADGESQAFRIAGASCCDEPAWSPDARWIAAVRVDDEHADVPAGHVFVVRPDGSGEREIDGDLASSYDPAWSPNASHLAFRGNNTDSDAETLDADHVYVAAVDGSALRSITVSAPRPSGRFIVWSADGDSVYYTAASAPCSECFEPGYLYMARSDGSSTPHKLFDEPVTQILGWTE